MLLCNPLKMSFPAYSESTASSAVACLYNKNDKHFMFGHKGVIGRSPSAFVWIAENYISRKHAVIEKTEHNKFTIRDMSYTGTFLNNKRLMKDQTYELNHLDVIKFSVMDTHTYVFVINKKLLDMQTPPRVKSGSVLTDKMIDLNESHSKEKENMKKNLDEVGSEMSRLQQELNALKAQAVEIEKERLEASLESASNKEQAERAEIKLKETMEDKEKVIREYEHKIADVTKKVEELQQNRNEMEERHKEERKEFENICKAEIEELKSKFRESVPGSQYEDLQTKLKEIKSVLLESELEQQRLFEAKVDVEKKLESRIVDLTNKFYQIYPSMLIPVEFLNPNQLFLSSLQGLRVKGKGAVKSSLGINEKENKAEQVKELIMKLKEKEELEERVKKEIEGLEDDMMCSICAELFIEPTALNCGHMFCKLCITHWSKKKKICPMCRAKLVTTVRIYSMDSVIQRNVRLMPIEAQARREALLAERKKEKTPNRRRYAKKRRYEATLPQPLNLAPGPSSRRDPVENIYVPYSPLRPSTSSAVEIPQGSEWDDEFQAGWVTNLRRLRSEAESLSPVPIAAVDLTNIPMVHIPAPVASRVHTHTATATSADANSTIDLTDL